MFDRLCSGPRSRINIGGILKEMLETLGKHGLSVEGNFSALLANIIVMEGLVRDLNPDINIFAKAAAFLL